VIVSDAYEAGARPGDVTIVAHDIGSVGGMERVLSELILGLRAAGHHVTVIARTCVLPPGSGVEFHRIRGPARPFLVAYPWFLLAGSLALRRWRRGLVQETGAIVVGHVDVIAIHYCHQVGPVTASRQTRMFRWHVRLVGLVNRVCERVAVAAARSATLVCVSEGVAEEMREHFPRDAGRVLTIHNGVDTDAFAPGPRASDAAELRARLGIPENRLLALFVGGEWERKGLRPLLEALAKSPEWSLLVAGSGDRASYAKLVASLGLEQAVHWLGVTEDVAPLYAAADVFVLPTSYETFSLVSFEAAASGVPVLATPVNGVRELVRDGVNGFLIGRDPAEIAARLAELAADPEMRVRLGAAARRSALEFSWARMVRDHADLYRRLEAPRSAA
jgi:glycosyltransferase involved in cell wall biosynthesis